MEVSGASTTATREALRCSLTQVIQLRTATTETLSLRNASNDSLNPVWRLTMYCPTVAMIFTSICLNFAFEGF